MLELVFVVPAATKKGTLWLGPTKMVPGPIACVVVTVCSARDGQPDAVCEVVEVVKVVLPPPGAANTVGLANPVHAVSAANRATLQSPRNLRGGCSRDVPTLSMLSLRQACIPNSIGKQRRHPRREVAS